MKMKRVLTPPAEYDAVILARETLAEGIVMLTLQAPEIAASAIPGQFVNIGCDRFLRRPLGIAGTDPEAGTILVGIQVKGEGTRDLAGRKAGTSLSVLGPLGNGFDLNGVETLIAVAGGTGLFPVLFLLTQARKAGIQTLAYCGYRSSDSAFLVDKVAGLADCASFASDTGDFGFHGNCVDALKVSACPDESGCRIDGRCLDRDKTLVAAIGPMPMMKAARLEALRLGLPCQVSLEERMACGFGVCLVCACKTRSDDPAIPYHHERCCVEGPVFDAEEVVWD